MKVSGNSTLRNFQSDYVFIRHAGADELENYDRIDFGLFGRSELASASWSLVFGPGITEANWREYLPSAKIDFMDSGDLLDVLASGYSNGHLFDINEKGRPPRPVHGVRTVISLDKLKTDARVECGGSLLSQIGLLEIDHSGNVRADTGATFDGQAYWNLYLG